MPPKRRGSMSEEERIIYIEQKRQAEESLMKKKEEMLAQYLKEKLSREEASCKFNLDKLCSRWRQLMRESKSRELKQDIEILSQTFERVVDRKDSVIKALVQDLEESEEQHCMALRTHLCSLDKLIALHEERMQSQEENMNSSQAGVVQEFDTERTAMIAEHQKETSELLDIMFAMEQRYLEQENESKTEFQSMRDEIKNKNLEEKHALRMQLETTIEDLWTQFQLALKGYNEATEERKRAFEDLKNKDEKSSREIDSQMRRIQRLSEQISQLKSKMAQGAKESEDTNTDLREEREAMLAHFQELKGQMNKHREKERGKLTKLTLESNAVIADLSRIAELGERILRVAEICRKLETEQEKVLPCYGSSLTDEETAEVIDTTGAPATQPLAELMHDYTSLENFWKRYNKVLLDKLVLEKERAMLARDNEQLRLVLKQYLDGISVNDEILANPNPLFVVNNKTNYQLAVPVTDPRVRKPGATVVEAAHVVRRQVL
ncbi:PREDICTED: coiled-coil domain-containing protein 65-like isoform X2 [Priapulus caudatus]|uniref:Dynein regulatory complex subunit 2 n=1 Tax=Priapulus caudatus TaxID=37621 RepID=A0ABM1EUR6_PRICU|nr:PREDICTED: coiled-coil domain-containing protein 65-like isoform X2 [Priapulus caudatus]